MKQSVKDLGWMYHILPVRKNLCPKPYPPLSIIPELGIEINECDEPPRPSIFKSTDTPYQTLSKMGGIHGLLYHKENDIIKKPPVPYPRCEWFYLDDQEAENYKKLDCSDARKYEFKVPDYMAFIPRKVKDHVCVDETKVYEKRKPKKIIRKKLPENRPGYSDYTVKPVKLTYAYRDYGRPVKLGFPKEDLSKEEENTKKVIENYYVRDYDKYRKQWNEIKYMEGLRSEVDRRKQFKKLSKELSSKLALANRNRLNGIFPF